VTSSYFGGSGADDMMSVTVNDDTVATCVGVSYSNNLPVLNAYQSTYVASGDGFAVRYKLSETWSSNAVIQDSKFNDSKIYPNPANSIVNVHSETSISEVLIRDVNGSIVKTFFVSNSNNVTFDISNLSAGLYFVAVYSEDSPISVQRLIKTE
jgi:hypothetical protein